MSAFRIRAINQGARVCVNSRNKKMMRESDREDTLVLEESVDLEVETIIDRSGRRSEVKVVSCKL